MNSLLARSRCRTSERACGLIRQRQAGRKTMLSSMRVLWDDEYETSSHSDHSMIVNAEYHHLTQESVHHPLLAKQQQQQQNYHRIPYASPQSLFQPPSAPSAPLPSASNTNYYHVSSLEQTLEAVLEMQRLGQVHNDTASWEGVVRSSIFSNANEWQANADHDDEDDDESSCLRTLSSASNLDPCSCPSASFL